MKELVLITGLTDLVRLSVTRGTQRRDIITGTDSRGANGIRILNFLRTSSVQKVADPVETIME